MKDKLLKEVVPYIEKEAKKRKQHLKPREIIIAIDINVQIRAFVPYSSVCIGQREEVLKYFKTVLLPWKKGWTEVSRRYYCCGDGTLQDSDLPENWKEVIQLSFPKAHNLRPASRVNC